MAEMNNTDPQAPCGPTHLYLLQMDSSINLSLNEQVLPLHLLDNVSIFNYLNNKYMPK